MIRCCIMCKDLKSAVLIDLLNFCELINIVPEGTIA